MTMRQCRKYVRRSVLLTLAVLFVIEAWLWEFGGRWLGKLVAWLPLEETKELIRRFVAPLSPWATLPVFLVPLLLITPFNFVAGWFFVKGKLAYGLFTLLTQKLLGVAVLSFMFRACKEKLLQLSAVRWIYTLLLQWYRAAYRMTQPYRETVKRWGRRLSVRFTWQKRGTKHVAYKILHHVRWKKK